MRKSSLRTVCLSASAVLAAGALTLVIVGAAESAPPVSAVKLPEPATAAMDFEKDIQPILELRCVKCHNAGKESAGLRLDDGPAALRGGNSGPAFVAGKSADSRMIRMVAGLEKDLLMPPPGKGKALTPEQIGKLRAWIDQGAKWSGSGGASTPLVVKSDHWAFLPVKRPTVPQVATSATIRNPIDNFVLARLAAEKLAPSPEADKPTLLRRAFFDFVGLPPTPEETDEFLNDDKPGAYERLIDRLLASPHFGERWGRHWLDMARYADSDGYEKDTGRPFAWRWREWVIGALNRDLPFDQFSVEQLAGDLLPGATLEQKVATGFHRNTLTNREGGVDREQFRVENVVDRVNTTTKVFLGVTMGCAQCHDHKYDPFSQKEYYRFFAFFNSDNETDIPAPAATDAGRYEKQKAAYDLKKAQLDKTVADRRKAIADTAEWEKSLKPAEVKKLPAPVAAVLKVDAKERTPAHKKALAEHVEKADAKLAELTKAVAAHEKGAPKPTMAQAITLGPVRKTKVLIRGDFLRPGAEVETGTPAVLPQVATKAAPNRLDLAKWIAAPENPLTARVTVNWVWQRMFGRGIVATLEDFGTQGEKPSHQDLLDWLAVEFREPTAAAGKPWSLKGLLKLIATSATYRQSSQMRPDLLHRDPINVLLARQSRLRVEAEIVRDTALTASGLLARNVGGPSVRPPQPPGISELSYAGSVKWVESTGADRYRRGMYIWFQRTSPFPMLTTFDTPDSNVSCVRRERTNTPLQALTLLNDTVFVECAQALGKRIAEQAGSPSDKIRFAVKVCLSRGATDEEMKILLGLFDELLAAAKADPAKAGKLVGKYAPAKMETAEAAAWVAMGRTLMNLDEFITRE